MELNVGDFIKVKPITGVLPFLQGRLGQIVDEILDETKFPLERKYFKIMVEGRAFTLHHSYMEKYERRYNERRQR